MLQNTSQLLYCVSANEEATVAIPTDPVALPLVALPIVQAAPIDVIQMSFVTESRVNIDSIGDEQVVDWGVGIIGGSIADRVAPRMRAHFASFGDLLRHDGEELVEEEDVIDEMQDLPEHDFLRSCFYLGFNDYIDHSIGGFALQIPSIL